MALFLARWYRDPGQVCRQGPLLMVEPVDGWKFGKFPMLNLWVSPVRIQVAFGPTVTLQTGRFWGLLGPSKVYYGVLTYEPMGCLQLTDSKWPVDLIKDTQALEANKAF